LVFYVYLNGSFDQTTAEKDIKEENRVVNLAKEYVQNRSKADSFINRFGYINATKRIKDIFPDSPLKIASPTPADRSLSRTKLSTTKIFFSSTTQSAPEPL